MAALSIGLRKEFFTALYNDVNQTITQTWIFHALAFIPMCMTIVFGTLLTANGSLKRLNIFALIALTAIIISNCIFIPLWGAVGAAFSFFLGQTILGIAQYIDVQISMKHRMSKHTWLKIGVLALVMGALFIYHTIQPMSTLNYSLLIIGIWSVLVFGLRIIDLKLILKSFLGK
jgi:O-antigen/teichoic acid export membrane protein